MGTDAGSPSGPLNPAAKLGLSKGLQEQPYGIAGTGRRSHKQQAGMWPREHCRFNAEPQDGEPGRARLSSRGCALLYPAVPCCALLCPVLSLQPAHGLCEPGNLLCSGLHAFV